MWTAWQSIIGWQDVRELGVLARFGGILYGMFAMLQLTLMLFFAPLFTAAAVSYEKDRRTFTLLLMTDLSDLEIVLGKLVAGLLNILTILAASVGLLSLCALLGGISFGQVANLFAVTAASGVAGGALGLLIALWRDRTFQSISLTILMVVFSVAGVEALLGRLSRRSSSWACRWSRCSIPTARCWRCSIPGPTSSPGVVRASSLVYIGCPADLRRAARGLRHLEAAELEPGREASRESCARRPRSRWSRRWSRSSAGVGRAPGRRRRGARWRPATTAMAQVAAAAVAAAPITLMAAHGPLRPARTTAALRSTTPGPTTGLHVPRRTHRRIAATPRPYRQPWTNPILWRELMTRAYGAKPLIIKGCYVLLFALGMGSSSAWPGDGKPAAARMCA